MIFSAQLCRRPLDRVSIAHLQKLGIPGASVIVRADEIQRIFTKPPVLSERFSSSASLQYHELLPSLDHLITYIQEKLCPEGDKACQNGVARISDAGFIDADYDTVSQSFTFSTFYDRPVSLNGVRAGAWNEHIVKCSSSLMTEVGILAEEKSTQPEELSLGGFLVTLGRDTKPSKYHDPSYRAD